MQKSKKLLAVLLAAVLMLTGLSLVTAAGAEAGAVTGLTASLSGTTVTLKWNAASGAAKYQVNQGTSKTGPWQSVKAVTGTSTTVSSGITAGNTYYFMIQGFTESGGARYYGAQSNVVSVTVAKAGAVGQATNFKATVSGTTVKMTWSAAANATHYEVQRSTKSGSGFASQKSVTGTSASQGSLGNGTYYYRVMPYKEVSGKRVYGTASNEQSVKIGSGGTPTPTGTVGQAKDLKATLKDTTVTLTWTAAANATMYEVQRSTKSGSGYASMKSVSGTSTTNGGLVKGNTYYYRIMPYKEVSGKRVYGTASAEVMVSLGSAGSNVGTVTGLKVTGVGSSTVSLKWDAASNALYYELRRSTNKNGPFTSLKTVTGTSTSNTVPDVGLYYYQVCGYVIKSDNTRSYGNPSDVVEAKVGIPGPVGSISSISVVKKNASTVTVSWTAAKNANKYILYGSTNNKTYKVKTSTDKTSVDWTVGNKGGTFYFKVLPVYQVSGKNKAEGGFSKITSIKMAKFTIPTVTGVTASSNAKVVTLKWKAVANATRYSISRATSASGTYDGMKTVSTTRTTNNVPAAGTYYYKVRAAILDFNGNRVYGKDSSAATVYVLLGETIETIKATDVNTITLTWKASSTYPDGYEVYRKAGSETSWSLMPSTHIKKTSTGYTFFDDTVVPGTKYSYSVVSYIIKNGVKTTSKIGANAKSLTTSIGTPSITAGYGISNTEGIFISWTDLPDVDTWEVQASTTIDSGFTTLATVDETTFSDYEKGVLRPDGVYLRTSSLANGIAYYVRVRGVSTVNDQNVNGTWSKPVLVSAPSVVFTDVSTTKSSTSVYLKVVNTGDMYLYLPTSGKYWTDGQNIASKKNITINGSTEVKPGQEVTSRRYDFSDGTARTPSSSSMFDITFRYNGYSYTIQPNRDGVDTWHIN